MFGTRSALPNIARNWNTAPTQASMVVPVNPVTGERSLDALTWGLLPYCSKDPKGQRSINARAETVAKLPTFRTAYVKPRGIVPISAFYEWKRDGKAKQPFAIARADGTPLALAGLWEGWRGADGEIIRSFCVLTTSANRVMEAVHDRMPVILEPESWPVRLGEREGDVAALLKPAEEDVLRLWPVSTAVNAVRNNGAALLEPFAANQASPPSAAPPGPNPA